MKKALAVLENSSSESEEDAQNHEDVSMMAVEDDKNVFNSIFSLVEESDEEEDLNEVTFFF